MSRFQRAVSHTDMDAYARSLGMGNANEYYEHLEILHRLETGGKITMQDVERAHARGPHIPIEEYYRFGNYVNGGATAHDRGARYGKPVARAYGVAEHQLPAVLDDQRELAGKLAIVEESEKVTERLDNRDAHRDRHNGMDGRQRVETARRAAMTNPDLIRRADIEHALDQHDPKPRLYARDRRELIARGIETNMESTRAAWVRDADPNRRPDRSDDRSDDIRRVMDEKMLDEAANDELAIAANPLLETVDNALTYAESAERE